jgi:uncharacterized protein (TIGR03083 family)
MVLDERHDLLRFFRSLTADQWETPSLCSGWRVRDVAAHLLVDEPTQAGMVERVLPIVVAQHFSIDRVNALWVTQNRTRTTDSIIGSFEEDTSSGVGLIGRLLGPAVALRALVIHHQDMRRPLHLARVIPPERLLAVLDAIVTRKGSISIGSRERAAGLNLRAIDVSWSHGSGPEVRGPAEAIIMALAGRGAALSDLDGQGTAILASRLRVD